MTLPNYQNPYYPDPNPLPTPAETGGTHGPVTITNNADNSALTLQSSDGKGEYGHFVNWNEHDWKDDDDDSQPDRTTFSWSKVECLKVLGTLKAHTTYAFSIALNTNDVDVNSAHLFHVQNQSYIYENYNSLIPITAYARVAKKVDLSGKYLAVTQNQAKTGYTPLKDIQNQMPTIDANKEIFFDNFDVYKGEPINGKDQEQKLSTLSTTGYTGSPYYIDLSKLSPLMKNLATNDGYSAMHASDGTLETAYTYPITPAPVFTSADGKTTLQPLDKNGVGNFYLMFDKIPNWVKPVTPANSGSGSNSNSVTTNPTPTTQPSQNSGATTPTVTPTPNNSTSTVVSNYAEVKGAVVYGIKGLYMYRHPTFAKNQRIARYPNQKRPNRPMFEIMGYARSNGGALRYKVRDLNHGTKSFGKIGYITANDKFVVNGYYQTMPKNKRITVIAKHGVYQYRTSSLKNRGKHDRQNAHLKVAKLVHYHLTTRYQLTNGHFVSANKRLVIQELH